MDKIQEIFYLSELSIIIDDGFKKIDIDEDIYDDDNTKLININFATLELTNEETVLYQRILIE